MKKKNNSIIVVSPVLDSVNFLNGYIKENKNHNEIIILYDSKETIGYYNKISNIKLIDIRFTRKFFSFISFIKLIKTIQQFNRAHSNFKVILNSPNSILYLFLFKIFLNNKKIYIVVHGLLEARSILIRSIYNLILNISIFFSYKTICVNKSYKFYFNKKVYYLKGIGFGLIKERYYEITKLKRIRKKSKRINIGYVGRYTKEKGFDRFIQLKEKLEVNIKNIKFNFYAYGDKKKKNYEIISKEIIYNNKEIAKFYSKIDILIFPSRGDSVGLAQLEALSSGAIILASNNNGSKQLKKIFNDQIFIINNWNLDGAFKKIREIIEKLETASKKLISQNQDNFLIENWKDIFR